MQTKLACTHAHGRLQTTSWIKRIGPFDVKKRLFRALLKPPDCRGFAVAYCLATIPLCIFISVRCQNPDLFLVDEALGSKLGLDFVTHSLRIGNDYFEYFILDAGGIFGPFIR